MSYLDRLGKWDRERYEKILGRMTPIERKIWDIVLLKYEAEPITGDDIAVRVGIDVRHVRGVIRTLRLDYFLPVGSTTRKPYGYYIITSEHDAMAMYKRLWKRGWAILRVAYKLKTMAKALPSFSQIRMDMENDQ